MAAKSVASQPESKESPSLDEVRSHEVMKPVAPPQESKDETSEIEQPTVPKVIPEVFLSAEHSAMCRVRTGDELPELTLSKLDGGSSDLRAMSGKRATVVLFWHADRWMSRTALEDLQKEVAGNSDSGEVVVVGIAVETPAPEVQRLLKATGATFPQLIDSDSKGFSKVGMVSLPRIYVLDASGKIVWFDIEYSEATRRELHDTLAVLTAGE